MKRTKFIVSDDELSDELSDDDYIPTKKVKITDKNKIKLDKIKKEISKRDIDLNNILNLELDMDDNIWFIEYFKILENTEEDTEEYFRIKKLIYDKYTNLKNIDVNLLNKLKKESNIETDIIQRILKSQQTDDIKLFLYKKYKRCIDSSNSDELFKVIDLVDLVLDLPIKIENKKYDINMLSQLWLHLNNNVSGLFHVKEKIMEVMCSKILSPESNGKIITLVGPPGVGKTSLAYSIAESMNLPFDQISFGSIKDSSILTGHSSTYIGAMPSLFTKILLKSKQLDMVILLDEIDKIPDTVEGNSISSVLLHILDKTQNYRFRDMYMPEINLDLSKILFICAANSLSDINHILRDRMSIIEINSYTINEKIDIVKNYLFPKIKKDLKINDKEIILKKKEIKYLIENPRNIEPNFY